MLAPLALFPLLHCPHPSLPQMLPLGLKKKTNKKINVIYDRTLLLATQRHIFLCGFLGLVQKAGLVR